MANRRMFSAAVVESDDFLDLKPKSQMLYFHLGMKADDDGFANPRSVMRSIGCTERYLKPLVDAGFVISFESGVICIADWRANNDLKKDRCKPTRYQNEFQQLSLDTKTGRYYVISRRNRDSLSDSSRIQNGNKVDTQYRIVEERLEQASVEQDSQEKDSCIPSALSAAHAPHKGATGGNTVLDSSNDKQVEPADAETEAIRKNFLANINRPGWSAAEADPPDVEQKGE